MRQVFLAGLLLAFAVGGASGDVAVITGDDVNLRKTPDKAKKPLHTLARGTTADILGYDEEWVQLRITTTGEVGWVHQRYVAVAAEPGMGTSPDRVVGREAALSMGWPDDSAYNGVITCKWLDNAPSNVNQLLRAAPVAITYVDQDCTEAKDYVLIEFGSEVALETIQDVVRALRNVPEAEIIEMGPDPQYQGAIFIGRARSPSRRGVNVGVNADAILRATRYDGPTALHGLREILTGH